LYPTYLRTFPWKDGWGGDFIFQSGADGDTFTLCSFGKDHVSDGSNPAAETKTRDFDCDIIITDGAFVQYPEGTQY